MSLRVAFRALLLLVLAVPIAQPHPVATPFDDGSNCGGQAPEVVECGTSYHVYTIAVDQDILVADDFTGTIASTLATGVPGMEAKRTLTCNVFEGRGPCRTTTSVPEELEPLDTLGEPPYAGIPFRHDCLVSPAAHGFWVCEVHHV